MNGSIVAQLGRQLRSSPATQPLRQAWATYMQHLDRSPVRTKAFTSVVAALLGDIIAQHASKPKDKPDWRFDWPRLARFAFFAGTFGGPVGHYWYKLLDARVMPHAMTAPRTIVTKVALDQLLFAPSCTPVFYAYKVTAEGRPGALKHELQEKFWPTLIAGWQLWPAAHAINFWLVPPQQRILYANVVSVAGTYLLSRAAAGDYSKKRHTEVLGDGLRIKAD